MYPFFNHDVPWADNNFVSRVVIGRPALAPEFATKRPASVRMRTSIKQPANQQKIASHMKYAGFGMATSCCIHEWCGACGSRTKWGNLGSIYLLRPVFSKPRLRLPIARPESPPSRSVLRPDSDPIIFRRPSVAIPLGRSWSGFSSSAR